MRKIRNLLKKILPLFMALTVLSMTASADELFDLNQTGSVSMVLTMDAKAVDVSDGVIEIYQVADITTDETGEYLYEYTADFKDCTADLSNPSATTLPDELSAYIDGHNIPAYAKTSPNIGKASFKELPLGIYLVRNTTASNGYYEFLPFVVTIPTSENGLLTYDVDASPKMEVIVPPTETEVEIETETEIVPENPNTPVQTGDYMTYGMLMVMTACIMALAIAGIRARRSRKSGN